MANRHYGNIGDIWKHLPLAEILSVEKPKRYWESHAGSAQYRLRHSQRRDYGVFHFLSHADQSLDLASASFLCLLDALKSGRGRSATYPGSPRIAMEMLGVGAWYFFSDIDGESLKTIRLAARSLGIPAGKLRCAKSDGVQAVLKATLKLPQDQASSTLVLIDPCAGDLPFLRKGRRPSPMDLFSVVTAVGAKAILWYSFDSLVQRQSAWQAIRASLGDHGIKPEARRIWCGEICLKAIHDVRAGFNPGVMGCGILCSNLCDQAVSASSRLGYELARIYTRSSFPDGRSGAFDFRSMPLDVAVLDLG